MSIKAMAAIVVAVAITAIAAREVQPSASMQSPWLREAVQVNEALPPGHPPIPEGRLPQGHPPIDRAPNLPPGHPPIPWMEPRCPGPDLDDGVIEGGQGFMRDAQEVIST
jgi:hypothetical protein